VFEFHFTKCVTTVQRGFRRNFLKNSLFANWILFFGLSRHLTVTSCASSGYCWSYVTSVVCRKKFLKFFQWLKFNFCMPFSFC
jgi:hypothetical protein